MEEKLTPRRQLLPHDAQFIHLLAIFEVDPAVLKVLRILDLDTEAFNRRGKTSFSCEVLAEGAKLQAVKVLGTAAGSAHGLELARRRRTHLHSRD